MVVSLRNPLYPFQGPKRWLADFNSIRRWVRPLVSLAVNVAWVAFAHYPRDGLLVLLGAIILRVAYILSCNLCTSRLRPPNPELFGGIAANPEASDSDTDTSSRRSSGSGVSLPYNPVRVLQERIERYESVGGRVQTGFNQVACALEGVNRFFAMDDVVISCIVLAALIGAFVALLLLPLPLVVSFVGCFLMRHPRLRTPTPSKALCLFARVPNNHDEVIYAKG